MPYNADWDMEMPFFKKMFQLVLKIFNSELVGNLGITMPDFVADTVWRGVDQLADIQRTVMRKLMNDRFRCDHPVFVLFPQAVKQSDRVC